jgi:dimeric dUTPase (all-alpha-NTP-PPase superfamily)
MNANVQAQEYPVTRHLSHVTFRLASAAVRPNPWPMEKPDQFRELWRMQKALNERIGVHTYEMSEADKTKWILNYCRAMTQEIAELTDSVPWKWWAKYQKFDEQNARVEVVDLFHFLISLAQVLGMSADDVFAAYLKKNEVNFKRQESGYTKKDEHDSRHI